MGHHTFPLIDVIETLLPSWQRHLQARLAQTAFNPVSRSDEYSLGLRPDRDGRMPQREDQLYPGPWLLLCVDADERGRSIRMVGLAVDENLTVEGHPARRGRFTLLPLASRPVDVCHQRSDARPRHVK
jgi:hypothetical protein